MSTRRPTVRRRAVAHPGAARRPANRPVREDLPCAGQAPPARAWGGQSSAPRRCTDEPVGDLADAAADDRPDDMADDRPDERAAEVTGHRHAERVVDLADDRPVGRTDQAAPIGAQRSAIGAQRSAVGAPDPTPAVSEPAAPRADPPAVGATEAVGAVRPSTFAALRVRNYRLFFAGQIVSNTGTWMQRIAQDWLVLELTRSPLAVGITTALQFLPMLLFGLWGGLIADRYPKRRLLLITQASMGGLAVMLTVLTLTGVVQVWQVYLIALGLGLATVVDNPTRQTFVNEMVPTDLVRNAVGLNSGNFQLARMLGPAVAGVLIAAVGIGWAFAFNALSFAAVLAALLMMRPAELQRLPHATRARGQLREGLRYVRRNPILLWPIVLVFFIGTFGYNFAIILAAYTQNVFQSGADLYGLLNTAMAAGSVTGALVAARRTSANLPVLFIAAGGFGLALVVLGLTPWFWAFLVLLVLVVIPGS